ncbi:MAG: minor capsid protein [Clostridium sp.]|uniref:minor capsid protein n=1 Tax=Clostridium sp. TaxID=1506 RepID=UPI00306FF0C6
MKNSEYWESRIANKTWQTYNNLEEKNRDLLEMYQDASLQISEELYKVTEKINGGKGITLSDMHKFKRLTGLQKNMEDIIRSIGESVEIFGKNNMMEGFKDTYSNIMVELGQTQFSMIPKKVMEEMMNRPWFGSSFSERLWKNTQVLASNLNEILVTGLTQGKTIAEIAIQLSNMMNTGFNISHKLVRTETMHYLNESAKKAYKNSGCEEVQVWAAVDERLCKVCGVKHGNIYRIKDCPTLPLHSNCRCTILPIVDREDAKKDHEAAKKDINNEFNKRHDLDNGLGNKNRKLNMPKDTLKHSNEGDFNNPRNPKKVKPGEIRLKSGGHGQDNIKLLEKRKIEYNIIKEYSNGVRCGNVPNHKEPAKKIGLGQVWFPKDWTEIKIKKAGEYVANLKDKSKYIIQEFKVNDEVVAIYKFANYDDVTVCTCYNTKLKRVMTIFPDGEQRMIGGD